MGKRGRYGARYSLNKASPYIKELVRDGWEVGQHINYYNYLDSGEIKKNKLRLENETGQKVLGCRSHYLRFDSQRSYNVLSKAGFLYDSSLGFSDSIGFRNGTAYPHIPSQIINKNKPFYELPLIVMDGALFDGMKLTLTDGYRRIIFLLEEYSNQNAVITILWHTGTMNNIDYQGWGKVYKDLLLFLFKNNINVRKAEDVIIKYHNYVLSRKNSN